MMRNIFKIGLFIVLLSHVQSCTYDEDFNVDPGAISEADLTPSTLLAPGIVGLAWGYGDDVSRYSTVFIQQMAGTSRQHQTIGQNSFPNNYSNTLFNFIVYGQIVPDMRALIKLAQEESPHYAGAAKFIEAFLICIISDLIGDVPYSTAFLGAEDLNPSYDSQESVMKAILELLDAAIVDMSAEKSLLSLGSEDLFYGGDMKKWIAAAHTLKARIYLQTRLRPEVGGADKVLAALENGIKSASGDLKFTFGETQLYSSPWFQWVTDRDDTRMGKMFIDMLLDNGNGVEDPRLPFYATKVDDEYAGSPYGKNSKTKASNIGPFLAKNTSTLYILTYAEAKFIEAEAQEVLGNKAEAAKALNEAIKASIMQVTGSAHSEFESANAYTAANVNLEEIIKQKYVALFGNYVNYNDWRRTGFPALTPVPGFSNGVEFVLSWPYPQTEIDLNDNVPADNNNLEKLQTKVWWDAN